MCMRVAKDTDIAETTSERFKEPTCIFNVTLGQRKSKIQTNSLTPSGKRKRTVVHKDVEVSIQATCYNILHRHLLEKKTSSNPHPGYPNTRT